MDIPACTLRFGNEAEALAYAIHNQRNRRNLTEAELLRCIEAVDKVKEVLKDESGKFTGGSSEPTGKSADHTAKIVGTSASKVKKARLAESDPEKKAAVLSGEKSINKASQDAKAKRYPPTPTEPITSEADKRQEVLMRALEYFPACPRLFAWFCTVFPGFSVYPFLLLPLQIINFTSKSWLFCQPAINQKKIINYENSMWNPCQAYRPGGIWDPIPGFRFQTSPCA